MAKKQLDVICLGRAAVDLYGQQVGGRLEDMQTFAKYLGGSSGNLAAGLGRLGAKSAMLTRVGDDHMGRFVREQLAREGVDVSNIKTDLSRLTGLVILGIGPNEDIPHVFFRERCADMGLKAEDINEDFIASAKMLALTGTHLSTQSTSEAVYRAVYAARKNNTHVLLDIDYRPVLWGLSSTGDGSNRYVESQEVSKILQVILPLCDIVVGTEEEIAIAGGSSDVLTAVKKVRTLCNGTIVLKRGGSGCTVFDIPEITSLEDGVVINGFDIEVFNTVGAGDAFLSGFLRAWLDEKTWHECGKLGNACGAIVVSRHGCTPAMPGPYELEYFFSQDPTPKSPRQDPELIHLHHTSLWTDDERPLCVLAYDHRSQFEDLAAKHGKSAKDISYFKKLLTEVLNDVAGDNSGAIRYGTIIDHRYGSEALDMIAEQNLWTASPIELPSSRPIEFDPQLATGQTISTWPQNRIVKCLAFYHPDDPEELRLKQEEQLQRLYADMVALDRRIVLEIICPDIGAKAQPNALPRALERLYDLDIKPDWWKLQSQSSEGWMKVTDIIKKRDTHCKGVVVLGLAADEEPLIEDLKIAAGFEICRGFAVGRSIFQDAADKWFSDQINDEDARISIETRYQRMINAWTSGLTDFQKQDQSAAGNQ